jgi:succinate-semialdehyde dehydrogenase/glutarate-semialdehyde dehydrogenase
MRKLVSTNPAKNYEVIGEVEVSSKKEIREKVARANAARGEWYALGIEGRVRILRKVWRAFSKRKEELALLATREMGMPISQSKSDIDDGLGYFKWYLDHAKDYLSPELTHQDDKTIHTVYYEPLGVAAVITPWNFPFSNVIWGCGQNFVAGNTIVFKHSGEVPLFGKLVEEIISGSGLPEGVFNEVYGNGEVGDYLVHQDINLICFTGSTKVGKYLYQLAAEKFIKATLELGGSAPGIVFKDADLDEILETLYFNRFINCGQCCDALKRLIIHESRFDEVVKRLREHLESKKVGDTEDKSTEIGPLVSRRQLRLLQSQVKDAVEKGAKVVTGGRSPADFKGAYYLPTILTNIKRDMRVWREEVFGPVLPVVNFKTETEAVELANDTRYGLGAYLFTKDKERAKRVAGKIETGMVSVNNASYLLPCNPFGGYKDSGFGREHGKYGFHHVCQIKVVSMEK